MQCALSRRPPRRSAAHVFPRGSRASGAENAARRGPIGHLLRDKFPTSVDRTPRFTPVSSQSSYMIRRVSLRRRTPLRRRRRSIRRAPMRRRRKTSHAPRLRRLSGVSIRSIVVSHFCHCPRTGKSARNGSAPAMGTGAGIVGRRRRTAANSASTTSCRDGGSPIPPRPTTQLT